MFIYRGGRPRDPRPSRDTGTAELVKKRLRLVDGGDPAMSTMPLGVYLERGLLDENYQAARKMYDAGMNYRYCYGVVFGRSSVRAVTADPTRGAPVDDELLAKIEPEYWRATGLLLKVRAVFTATWKVCVNDQYADGPELARLRTGLRWLVRA